MFKYGVVRMNDLVHDIMDWKSFYLSGRLQKPVCSVQILVSSIYCLFIR